MVLLYCNHGVKMIEGTKYVTSSLVLPLVYQLIAILKNPELILHWDTGSPIPTTHQTPELKTARTLYLQAVINRFIDALPLETKAHCAICTLLNLLNLSCVKNGQGGMSQSQIQYQCNQIKYLLRLLNTLTKGH